MRIYIAAPYPIRHQAVEVMNWLEATGHTVTSRWLRGEVEGNTDENARKDFDDIASSDALLLINPQDWANVGTGGRHVELGYALAIGITVILLGVRTNVFHHHSNVRVIGMLSEL